MIYVDEIMNNVSNKPKMVYIDEAINNKSNAQGNLVNYHDEGPLYISLNFNNKK